MGLKIIHNEIIKFIGLKAKTLDSIYEYIESSQKFSKLGINFINFSEAMGKLKRLEYIHIPENVTGVVYSLTADGVKIYLKMIDKERK